MRLVHALRLTIGSDRRIVSATLKLSIREKAEPHPVKTIDWKAASSNRDLSPKGSKMAKPHTLKAIDLKAVPSNRDLSLKGSKMAKPHLIIIKAIDLKGVTSKSIQNG